VHRYRSGKAQHSGLFPGCSGAIIACEKELLDRSSVSIGHMTAADCRQILQKAPPPAQEDSAESLVLRLQAAVMKGRSGIVEYVRDVMTPTLTNQATAFPGRPAVLRLFCHLCIWLRNYSISADSAAEDSFTPEFEHKQSGSVSSGWREVISDDTLFLAVEAYVDHLIEDDQPLLVATYVTFLSRSRRIAKYAQLLRVLQQPSTSASSYRSQRTTEDGQVPAVLRLAKMLFPDDVIAITRAVVEEQPTPTASAANPFAVTTFSSPTSTSYLSKPIDRDQHTRSVRFKLNNSTSTALSPEAEDSVMMSGSSIILQSAESPAPTKTSFTSLRSVKNRSATPRNLRKSSHKGTSNSSLNVLSESNALVLSTNNTANTSTNRQNLWESSWRQRMEALRWLFFEPAHRLEAVKQTNRLVLQLLMTDDAAVLPLLRALVVSGEYLPLNSVAMGYDQLKLRKDELDELIGPTLYSHLDKKKRKNGKGRKFVTQEQPPYTPLSSSFNGGTTSECGDEEEMEEHVRVFRGALELDEVVWEAQVSQLELWQLYVAALEDVSACSQLFNDYRDARSRCVGNREEVAASLIGRFGPKTVRSTELATDSLLKVLHCAASSSESRSPSDGFKEVWDRAQQAGQCSLVAAIASIRGIMTVNGDGGGGQGGQMDTVENEVGLGRTSDEGKALLEECKGVRELLLSELPQNLLKPKVQQELLDLVQLEVPRSCPADGEAELEVCKLLHLCKQTVCDLVNGCSVRATLLYSILSSYIKVCNDAAAVLQDLNSTEFEVAKWYCRVIKLADLIASDSLSLKLYKLLKRKDMEMILDGINRAAKNLLQLDPSLDMLMRVDI